MLFSEAENLARYTAKLLVGPVERQGKALVSGENATVNHTQMCCSQARGRQRWPPPGAPDEELFQMLRSYDPS